jgi:hypothetical protein
LIPCETPIPTRQRWELDIHSRSFCIKKGATVLVLHKEKRRSKSNGADVLLNPPVDNLLSENFDHRFIHYWLEGRVIDIKDGSYHIQYPTKTEIEKIKITSSSVVPDLDLVYQLNETPQKGDVMLVKNGGIIVNDILVNEDNVYWKAVILDKVPKTNNLFKVALSINSIEPNANNESKGRPSQTSVKQLSVDKMRFLRYANVCNSSIEI